jgi:hypothetical protein
LRSNDPEYYCCAHDVAAKHGRQHHHILVTPGCLSVCPIVQFFSYSELLLDR